MSIPIKFGTDGWRGIIADEFTFDNVRACAQATALQVRPDMSAAKLGLVYCQLRLLHFTDAMTTARQALIDGEPGGTFAPLIAFADSALAAHDTVPSPIVRPHKGARPTLAVVMGNPGQ